MYACIDFYGAYTYSGLVRQVSRFITVSVSAQGTCRILDSTGFMGGGKTYPKTRETAALRRGIQKASHTKQSHVSSECVTAKFFFAPGQDLFNFWCYEVRPSDLLTLYLLPGNIHYGVNENFTVYTQYISRPHKNILCNCQTDFT